MYFSVAIHLWFTILTGFMRIFWISLFYLSNLCSPSHHSYISDARGKNSLNRLWQQEQTEFLSGMFYFFIGVGVLKDKANISVSQVIIWRVSSTLNLSNGFQPLRWSISMLIKYLPLVDTSFLVSIKIIIKVEQCHMLCRAPFHVSPKNC